MDGSEKKTIVKKQAVLRGEDQADKRETDPEYLLKLEEYKRGQEGLRLKQEAFAKRQREYEEKKEKKKVEQARRLEILEEQRARMMAKKVGETKAKEALEGKKKVEIA